MSCRFAPVRIAARGMPLASVMRWCLLPSLRLSTGLGPVFPPATDRANRCAVNDRPRPVDPVRGAQLGKQRGVQLLPHACLLPISKTSPTCHARTTSHLLGQHLPRNTAPQHEQDAGQRLSVLDRLPTGVSITPRLGGGSNGSTISHSASVTRGVAMESSFGGELYCMSSWMRV